MYILLMIAVIASPTALNVKKVTTKRGFWQNKLLVREKPSLAETLYNYILKPLSKQGRT